MKDRCKSRAEYWEIGLLGCERLSPPLSSLVCWRGPWRKPVIVRGHPPTSTESVGAANRPGALTSELPTKSLYGRQPAAALERPRSRMRVAAGG